MNELTRKDSIASAAVLATILVSAICGTFAINVQATGEANVRETPAACITEA